MQFFQIHYDGWHFSVQASSHVAARRLGLRMLANTFSIVDCDKVAVVDPVIAGKHVHAHLDSICHGGFVL